MMGEKKGKAAPATKRGKRGEAGGPPTSTPNEARQGRKGGGGKGRGDGVPRTGKSQTGRGDSEGGGLH